MDFTKRKLFLLLLGSCGVILILLASFLDFGSTREIFLVAANFHNSSLSYMTSLNLNLGDLPGDNKMLKTALVNERFRNNLNEIIRNPKFNVTGVTLRYINQHNNSVSRDYNSVLRNNKSVSRDNYSVPRDINSASRDNSASFNSDNGVNVGEVTNATKSDKTNRTTVKSFVNKSHLETGRAYFIKSNFVSAKTYNQSRLNNGFKVSNNRQAFNQNISNSNYTTNVLNQTEHAIDERLLYRNRSDHDGQPLQEAKQSHNSNNNVKVDEQADFIKEKVLIPRRNSIANDIVHKTYDLPKQGEVNITDKNKLHETSYKAASKQQTYNLENKVQRNSQHQEAFRTEDDRYNNQGSTGNIPPEIFQKYMTNNEAVINDDVIEASRAIQTSDGNRQNRRLIDEGTNPYQGNLQDMDNISPQNNQHSIGDVLQQRLDVANKGPVERSTNLSGSKMFQEASKVEEFTVDPSCSTGETVVEDILCMKRPQFLPDFRNPCWYQHGVLKCLPYFQIIGVCKTGTTDLFERLSRHPQVLKNRGILGKETWYWTWKRYGHSNFYKTYTEQMTLNNFIDQFEAQAIERYTKRLLNGTLYHPAVTGHGDPMDFWDQSSWKRIPQNNFTADVPKFTTPSLIKHVNPNIKLILILRDPIERLFSNYLHGQFGSTADEFHRDVVLSRDLLRACTRNRSMRSCLYDENIIRSLRVPISGSFYSVHIKEWLNVFPRKQIFITRTEAFAKNIADTLLGIFRFLHLDPMPTRDVYRIANVPHFYKTEGKKTAGSIRQETRDILRPMFEPYNIELANILKDENFNFNNIR